MLRPVRPLRRSVDLPRRTSQGSKVRSSSSSQSTSVTRENAASDVSAADARPANQATTSLPSLRLCLTTPKNRSCGAAEPPGRRISGCTTTAGLADAEPHIDACRAGCAMDDDGAVGRNAATLAPQRPPGLRVATQRFFTPGEIVQLRMDARLEYNKGRRLQERKDVIREEEQQRCLLTEDAMDQAHALHRWEREKFEALLRAQSAEALPFQFLEQRIQARIMRDYAREDAELRREGRAAWLEQLEKEKAAAIEMNTNAVERRAASHRFRAALTFIVVQERNVRTSLEEEATHHWEAFAQAEEASRADAAQRALERFLNTPEQLAIAEARERRERHEAKVFARLRKLFEGQQEKYIKGCHHATGGMSVFEGNAPKKICGRCRVKWDESLGYYVSLDRGVKIHPPPLPPSATDGGAKQHGNASTEAARSASAAPGSKAAPARRKAKG